MKQSINNETAVVICRQLVMSEDIDDDGLHSVDECGCVVNLSYARSLEWVCPMCEANNSKEDWVPSTTLTVSEEGKNNV